MSRTPLPFFLVCVIILTYGRGNAVRGERKMKNVFEKPTLLQLLLGIAAGCFALVAFGLFFADAVGDKGGDGLPAFKIAFDVMIDGLHFNARAFIAYFIPLLCVAVVLPFKEKKVYYAAAFLLLAASVAIFLMREIYLSKYDAEIADMYRKGGVRLAVPAIIAGVFCLISSALSLLRGLAGVKFAVKKEQVVPGECTNENTVEERQ